MAEADDTHEGTPNPALGLPKDVETDLSDVELAGPNPALDPAKDVETDFLDADVVEPPAKCAKCERYLQLQYDFDSLADSHQTISDALKKKISS